MKSMKENKKGIPGHTIYRPKRMDFRSIVMEDPGSDKETPGTKIHHHEEYLDEFPY